MTSTQSENDELFTRIHDQIDKIVVNCGAELVDIDIIGSRNQPTLRIFLHKHPSLELTLCAKISREIGDYLDIEDPVTGRYRLEVTSPGLDRPLTTDKDFRRAYGHLLKVTDLNGKTKKGRLTEWNDKVIFLENKKSFVEQISRTEIAKATIEVEFKKRG